MSKEIKPPDPDNEIDPLIVGELISISEAAKLTGYSRGYLHDIIQSGRLRARRIGNQWVTTLAAIEEYKRTRKYIVKEES